MPVLIHIPITLLLILTKHREFVRIQLLSFHSQPKGEEAHFHPGHLITVREIGIPAVLEQCIMILYILYSGQFLSSSFHRPVFQDLFHCLFLLRFGKSLLPGILLLLFFLIFRRLF